MNKKYKAPFFDKEYLTRVGLYVGVTILAVCAIIYIGFHISGNMKEQISVMYARSETVSESVTGQAFIIREEYPIDGAVNGHLSPVVPDGAKVIVGQRVADVYSSASVQTQSKINLIEDQIAFYEKCINNHLSVGDSSAVSKQISADVLSVRRQSVNGDFKGAASLKASLALDIRRLGVLTGKVTDFSGRIASLTAELNTLRASMGQVTGTVYAPSSGYYFSYTDGYENVFSSADIDSVTYSDVISMIDEAASKDVGAEKSSAGKIVGSFKWYVACKMSASDTSHYSEGKYYDMVLKNNGSAPVSMKLDRVLTNGTDAVALFECSVMPEGFDYSRSQSYEVVHNKVEGYKIPISAVRIHDGFEGVFILDEVTVKFRRISVIDSENGYVLCRLASDIPAEEGGEAPSDDNGAETTAPETSEGTGEPYYPFLQENDIVIKVGTGLHVGMTYEP
ncbi:MAG: hypothetical protein IJO81_01585 [Clostridia bacterium]|nr:hypothetical protein [Clostridia bacterium]